MILPFIGITLDFRNQKKIKQEQPELMKNKKKVVLKQNQNCTSHFSLSDFDGFYCMIVSRKFKCPMLSHTVKDYLEKEGDEYFLLHPSLKFLRLPELKDFQCSRKKLEELKNKKIWGEMKDSDEFSYLWYLKKLKNDIVKVWNGDNKNKLKIEKREKNSELIEYFMGFFEEKENLKEQDLKTKNYFSDEWKIYKKLGKNYLKPFFLDNGINLDLFRLPAKNKMKKDDLVEKYFKLRNKKVTKFKSESGSNNKLKDEKEIEKHNQDKFGFDYKKIRFFEENNDIETYISQQSHLMVFPFTE